ncbi:MAG: hypothetical protein JWO67_4076 [Streptosporangiaceae bacterium]|nr:hypothetical protein [Streptosporangiaceae bacterium]
MGNLSDLIAAGLIPPERIEVSLRVPYDEIGALTDQVFEVMDLNEQDGDETKLADQRFELLGDMAERLTGWIRTCGRSRHILPAVKS